MFDLADLTTIGAAQSWASALLGLWARLAGGKESGLSGSSWVVVWRFLVDFGVSLDAVFAWQGSVLDAWFSPADACANVGWHSVLMVMIPAKPWPRRMGPVERATCVLPDFDAVREVLADGEIREVTWSRIGGEVDDELDLDGKGKPFDPYEMHSERDLAIAEARAVLFSAEEWMRAEWALYTDEVDSVVVEGWHPVLLSAEVEGYGVRGRWRESVYGPEYSSGGVGITPDPTHDLMASHEISSRRYAEWQEHADSVPNPHVGPEWQRVAFLILWGIRQHKASAVCNGDHGCCEVCAACMIEVPDYVAAGRPEYELPEDDPGQRQADIAASQRALAEENQLIADLNAKCESASEGEERRESRRHMRDTLGTWRSMQARLAQRTFTLVHGPAGPQWQVDE